MRGLSFVLFGLVAGALLGGCAGGAGPLAGNGASTSAYDGSFIGTPEQRAQRLIRFHLTPAYPPARHRALTPADRARAKAGGWQELQAASPFTNGPGTAMLMTDGTILVNDSCTPNWFALSPDSHGNYIDGTWTQKGSMSSSYGPLYFASAILPDGKLIVNGGEYNFCQSQETTLGAIYDPDTNVWTSVAPPSGWSRIGDGQSAVLPNGTYMLGNCCTTAQALYNESSNTWTLAGGGKKDANSEEGWTLLRNGNLIVADVIAAPNAESYSPSSNAWTSAGTLPQNLTQSEEIGPQSMRPDDTVFVVGANEYTAIYSEKSASWTQGPNNPTVGGQQLDVADGPSTVLTDGQVILPESPGVYNSPSYFYLFNGKKFKSIAGPPNESQDSSYDFRLLLLPNGQVLEDDGSSDIELYTVKHAPMAGLKPTITKVASSLVAGTTNTLSGTKLNGFSQQNFYGDDNQQATNFPLVRITNKASGAVVYCRTHGFSTMAIGSSGSASTSFDVPASIGTGASTLQVVTNGIASKAFNVTVTSSK